ncbi:MAG: rRNA maturation RNase YbeY [Gammaproteobacteria bacterium]
MNRLSLSVQYADGGDPPPPSRSRVRALIGGALPDGGEVAVRFVAAAEMREINRRRRGKNAASDILSFAYHEAGAPVLGDIVVCPAAAADVARRRRRPPSDHLAHLIVHGALHLAGWRHDTPRAAARMEKTERETLARFGVADPYAPA